MVLFNCDICTSPDVVITAYETRRDELPVGIDLPFPTQVLLFPDQSEATDGNRRHQREGWPAGDNPLAPRAVANTEAEHGKV
ncbi:hypothetical protein FB595_1545 [Sphingobium sp. AEW010]|nr:hypothetical protein [Sphingobium sp. JAI105]TWC96176.1 hypothetical protein FB595_1545 [Sphingobium sp. AEW010]TWD15137.1 hypothetical protein FB596_1562 [Sphingobium sp. AEW013]TWD19175.1 hypothetical protein FB594_1552 [Sphingobium sp. AEW001]